MRGTSLSGAALVAMVGSVGFSGAAPPVTAYASYVCIGVFALVALWTADRTRLPTSAVAGKGVLYSYCALTIIAVTTLLWAPELRISLSPAIQFVVLTMAIAGLSVYLTREHAFNFFLAAFAWTGAVMGTVLLVQYVAGTGARAEGLGGPNSVGVLLAVCAASAFLKAHVNRRVAPLLAAILSVMGIASTYSVRSVAFLALTALVGVCVTTFATLFLRGRAPLLSAVALLISLVGLLYFPALRDWALARQGGLFATYGAQVAEKLVLDANAERVRFYSQGVDVLATSLPFGTGFESSRYYFERELGIPTYSHNTILELLIGGGVLALIVYAGLFLLILAYASLAVLRGSRIIGPFCIAMVIAVLALGWTMALYVNVPVTLFVMWLYAAVSSPTMWRRLEAGGNA